MPAIPDPELVSESVQGQVYALPGGTALVVGEPPSALSAITPTLRGTLVVRYGISLIAPPREVIVPGLFAAEKGAILVGREAWDFMLTRFQMHPRADVVGLLSNGRQAQYFLRELDFGVPPRVLICSGPRAENRFVEANVLVIGENAAPLPDLLAQYLPIAGDLARLLTR